MHRIDKCLIYSNIYTFYYILIVLVFHKTHFIMSDNKHRGLCRSKRDLYFFKIKIV